MADCRDWIARGCLVAYEGSLWYCQPELEGVLYLFEKRHQVGAPMLAAHALNLGPNAVTKPTPDEVASFRERREDVVVGPAPQPPSPLAPFEMDRT